VPGAWRRAPGCFLREPARRPRSAPRLMRHRRAARRWCSSSWRTSRRTCRTWR
jgi:hypothetical protein